MCNLVFFSSFLFFLFFEFFGFLVFYFFLGFLVCCVDSPDLAHGSVFFGFFGFLEVLAKLQKTMEKPKKQVQTHVPCQASPQTLPMGLNLFFCVFSIVVLHVFDVKMLSSQYLSKKCGSLQFAHLRPPGQTAKKHGKTKIHLMTYIMTNIMINIMINVMTYLFMSIMSKIMIKK